MPVIILFLCIILAIVIFMLNCYSSFKIYREPAFATFFAVAAAVLILLTWGFMHFKPWVGIY